MNPARTGVGPLAWTGILAGALVVAAVLRSTLQAGAAPGHGQIDTESLSRRLPQLWQLGVLPFAGILACIAFLPLLKVTQHWWHSNRNKLIVSLVAALMTILYCGWAEGFGGAGLALHHAVFEEYIPFMVLLYSLYVISGGICLKGDLAAHPLTNTAFLAVGALIASVIGTTGASMLLIRPLLKTNSQRKHVTHTVIFFIFLVSNVGGCLLPIGDPPLFLGYLKGVPFLWTLILWKEWAFCCAALLVVYYAWDRVAYRREKPSSIRRDETRVKPLRISGSLNLLWLAGVVLCVALVNPTRTIPGTSFAPPPLTREIIMLIFVVLSLRFTPAAARRDNQFNYAAILEVAALFIGIFVAMQVPVEVLNLKGESLGLKHPWEFFWASGGLSSFLDNAPTYVVFFETADAMTHAPGPGIITLLGGQFIREDLLIAISLGSVFMGANTYIGNGPNFMVKAIAEQSGVKMPSFLEYFFRYALPILIPLFVIVTILFLL